MQQQQLGVLHSFGISLKPQVDLCSHNSFPFFTSYGAVFQNDWRKTLYLSYYSNLHVTRGANSTINRSRFLNITRNLPKARTRCNSFWFWFCLVENNWGDMTIAIRSVWEVLHSRLAKNKTSGEVRMSTKGN